MLNKKVILIAGYSRGGTNLLWNILQSHPDITSPIYETGTILRKQKPLKFSKIINLLKKAGILHTAFAYRLIDTYLYRLKLSNLKHPDNKYIREGELYKKDQLSKTALCLKSVDFDIYHTDLLLKMYPDLYLILLTRNGLALANGHIRRGATAEETGNLYKEISSQFLHFAEKANHTQVIKFEDMIEAPFKTAHQVFNFVGAEADQLKKLRFKSKKVLSKQGEHDTAYGEEHRKYWFDERTVWDIIDPSINKKQLRHLSESDLTIFRKIAGPALKKLGYN